MIVCGEEIFFVPFEKDPCNVIVYVPLRSYIALCDKSLQDEFLNNHDGEICSEFIKMMQNRELVDIMKIHQKNREILPLLSLPITDNCNLKCGYCYFRAGDTDKKAKMTKSQIEAYVNAYIDALDRYPVKKKGKVIDVSIAGGGEPTVEFDLFCYTVELIEERMKGLGITPHFSMPTNGAYGEKVRDFILNHFHQISFSLDGPKEIQDIQRPFRNGKGSFDCVFETAKYFYKNGLQMAFRVTVTNKSVGRLREILDFFDSEFKGINVGLEAMNLFGRAVGNEELLPPDPKEYSEALLDAHKYAMEKGMSIKNASTGKFECLRTVFCGAVGIPNWTVTCDGRVTSCTRDNMPEEFSFGCFDEKTRKVLLDEAKVERLRNMSVFTFPECQDCFCKYNCAGDCPDLRLAKMLNCDATRKVGAYILNKKFE